MLTAAGRGTLDDFGHRLLVLRRSRLRHVQDGRIRSTIQSLATADGMRTSRGSCDTDQVDLDGRGHFVSVGIERGGAGAAARDRRRPVQCADDPAQSYALYLPSTYSPERTWSLLLAFHPAARGRLMVEKFQAAAEQYGYIVAASNNSRNGPYAVSSAAAQAMSADVGRRFSIDPQRVYLAGMSGGARVAMGIALAKNNIAGVIASSAGYPDSQPRDSVPFAVFSTAGTEDFNYLEMRLLDRKLSSPHFLAVFEGGHTLPPDDVAFDALEWMELQAMQSGRRASR